MPRNEKNNPTERMGHVLADAKRLQEWGRLLYQIARDAGSDPPPMPFCAAIERELIRREYTLSRIQSARMSMRYTRARREASIAPLRGRTKYKPEVHDGVIQENLEEEFKPKEIKADFDQTPPEIGFDETEAGVSQDVLDKIYRKEKEGKL